MDDERVTLRERVARLELLLKKQLPVAPGDVYPVAEPLHLSPSDIESTDIRGQDDITDRRAPFVSVLDEAEVNNLHALF